jgi:hypothetical protein
MYGLKPVPFKERVLTQTLGPRPPSHSSVSEKLIWINLSLSAPGWRATLLSSSASPLFDGSLARLPLLRHRFFGLRAPVLGRDSSLEWSSLSSLFHPFNLEAVEARTRFAIAGEQGCRCVK